MLRSCAREYLLGFTGKASEDHEAMLLPQSKMGKPALNPGFPISINLQKISMSSCFTDSYSSNRSVLPLHLKMYQKSILLDLRGFH